MSYDLLAWNAWARNATPDEIAEKLTQQHAEVARLRSVCMEAATTVRRVGYMTTDVYSAMLVQAAKTLAEAGKEAMR